MKHKYDPDLMAIFKFTAQDLEINRTGVISERQMKRLKKEFSLILKQSAAIYCVSLPVILLYISGMYNSSLRYGEFRLLMDAFVLFCIIVILAFPIFFIRFYLRVRAILAQNRVRLIDGKIEFRHIPLLTEPNQIDFIRVSKKRFFSLEADTILRLKQYDLHGSVYRLHYIPFQNKILSAEKIE